MTLFICIRNQGRANDSEPPLMRDAGCSRIPEGLRGLQTALPRFRKNTSPIYGVISTRINPVEPVRNMNPLAQPSP
jgi:hypothetical protein